ncbi:family 43 glycosylhydrolase [Verrucomicrobiales bacterium]|nr:family 43 glycosylhydrolase [Verrucomicrobiales bacterium]
MATRFLSCLLFGALVPLASAEREIKTVEVTYTPLKGLEPDPDGFDRRDNSDIIKVGDLYYVWYSKLNQDLEPTISNIWYATSPDGITWTEKGQSVTTGEKGSWDERVVYTPGILAADGKYYLFYTAQSFEETGWEEGAPKTFIGIASSDSPDGPWVKSPDNPVLLPSEDKTQFDSFRIDDSCLIKRDGKYWLYYKGREWMKPPTETKMGVAIAEKPEGPYKKNPNNPLAEGGHEVLVWPEGDGVGALVGMKLGKEVPFRLMHAEDGLNFKKTGLISNFNAPWAAGAFRPEAFTDNGKGEMIEWGLHIAGKRPNVLLERFDLAK